jgi:FtsZ-interacting cell division protein ZipA
VGTCRPTMSTIIIVVIIIIIIIIIMQSLPHAPVTDPKVTRTSEKREKRRI